jgi:hypothetical protein
MINLLGADFQIWRSSFTEQGRKRRSKMNTPMSLAEPVLEHALDAGLSARMRVTGSSMRPFSRAGDVLEFAPAGTASPRHGEILLVRRDDGGLVLHCVTRFQRIRFLSSW